ncbi:hypothetical protein AAMO2058_000221000 [Amorphochlora amoebiformis]
MDTDDVKMGDVKDTPEVGFRSKFVADITVPDGMEFEPDEKVDKVWEMRNDGNQAWPRNLCARQQEGGNWPGAPESCDLDIKTTTPGATARIEVRLRSPPEQGHYKAVYKLAAGSKMFLGDMMWVEINVKPPVDYTRITRARLATLMGVTNMGFDENAAYDALLKAKWDAASAVDALLKNPTPPSGREKKDRKVSKVAEGKAEAKAAEGKIYEGKAEGKAKRVTSGSGGPEHKEGKGGKRSDTMGLDTSFEKKAKRPSIDLKALKDLNISLTGLRNLGNTCYMNSVLQCLAHTPPLQHQFQTWAPPSTARITQAFRNTLLGLWTGLSSYSPEVLHETIVGFYPAFKGKQQQDSLELFKALIDGLQSEIPTVSKKLKMTREKSMEPSPHTPTRSPNPQAAKAKESKGKYELPESWISQVSALEISSGFFVKGLRFVLRGGQNIVYGSVTSSADNAMEPIYRTEYIREVYGVQRPERLAASLSIVLNTGREISGKTGIRNPQGSSFRFQASEGKQVVGLKMDSKGDIVGIVEAELAAYEKEGILTATFGNLDVTEPLRRGVIRGYLKFDKGMDFAKLYNCKSSALEPQFLKIRYRLAGTVKVRELPQLLTQTQEILVGPLEQAVGHHNLHPAEEPSQAPHPQRQPKATAQAGQAEEKPESNPNPNLNPKPKPNPNPRVGMWKGWVDSIFKGTIDCCITCQNCKNERHSLQAFLELSVPIRRPSDSKNEPIASNNPAAAPAPARSAASEGPSNPPSNSESNPTPQGIDEGVGRLGVGEGQRKVCGAAKGSQGSQGSEDTEGNRQKTDTQKQGQQANTQKRGQQTNNDLNGLDRGKKEKMLTLCNLGLSRSRARVLLERSNWDIKVAADSAFTPPRGSLKQIVPKTGRFVHSLKFWIREGCLDNEEGEWKMQTVYGMPEAGNDRAPLVFEEGDYLVEVSGDHHPRHLASNIRFVTNNGKIMEPYTQKRGTAQGGSAFHFRAVEGHEIVALTVSNNTIRGIIQKAADDIKFPVLANLRMAPSSDHHHTHTQSTSESNPDNKKPNSVSNDHVYKPAVWRVVYIDGVNVREMPYLNSKIVKGLDYGQMVVALDLFIDLTGLRWIRHSSGWSLCEQKKTIFLSKTDKDPRMLTFQTPNNPKHDSKLDSKPDPKPNSKPDPKPKPKSDPSYTHDEPGDNKAKALDSTNVILTCPQGHSLVEHKTHTANYFCDVCKIKFKKNATTFRCATCDWDSCRSCRLGLPEWSCPICTFINKPSYDKCQACNSGRPKSSTDSKSKTPTQTPSQSDPKEEPKEEPTPLSNSHEALEIGIAANSEFEDRVMILLDAHGKQLGTNGKSNLLTTFDPPANPRQELNPPQRLKIKIHKTDQPGVYKISTLQNVKAFLTVESKSGKLLFLTKSPKNIAWARWKVEVQQLHRIFFVNVQSGNTIKASPEGEVCCTANTRGEWEGFVPIYLGEGPKGKAKAVAKDEPKPQQKPNPNPKPHQETLRLEECLAASSEGEMLEYRCSKCSEITEGKRRYVNRMAYKQDRVYHTPKVLVIHLKRYTGWGESLRKITCPVILPKVLDVNPFLAPLGEKERLELKRVSAEEKAKFGKYSLFGLVCHGGSLSGGHYVAYVKHSGTWYFISDSKVLLENLPTQPNHTYSHLP